MRLVDRLATLALSLVLLAGGLLFAAEAVLVALHLPALLIDRAGWYDGLTRTRVDHPLVRGIAIVVAAVGLLILVAQLVRWRPDRIGARSGADWHLKRRSVERRLTAAVDEVPGVVRSRVRLVRGPGGWGPRIRVVGPAEVPAAVEDAARRELDRLGAPTDQVHVVLGRARRAPAEREPA